MGSDGNRDGLLGVRKGRLGIRVGWRRDRSEAEKSQDPFLGELMGSFTTSSVCYSPVREGFPVSLPTGFSLSLFFFLFL